MRIRNWVVISLFGGLLLHSSVAKSAEWDPVSDEEKALKQDPIDPGSGAVVLFKRGKISVLEHGSSLWLTTMETYVRIKVFSEAGLDAANVSFEVPKYVRLSKVEGRTILASGQIVALDPTQIFRGRTSGAGNRNSSLKTTFALPSVEPGAILEYQLVETVDWYFFPPWTFDTPKLGTLHSALSVLVGPRLLLAQYPLETARKHIQFNKVSTALGDQFDYSVDNLAPIREEVYGLPFGDQACAVLFTPFELAFNGQTFPIIQKWNDVATLINSIFQDAIKKSSHAKDQAKRLAGKSSDERQRAEAIYRFVQQAIASSGAGGVLPSRVVDEVLDDKRGDPDEINALFITMLREVKLDADPVLIATRDSQTLTGRFPNISEFTRMVTRIRFKDGVVLADPGEPAAPFGELPWFEQGLTGLAINGNKAEEAVIPLTTPENNATTIKLTSQIHDDGAVEAQLETALTGAGALGVRSDFQEEPDEKLEQALIDYLDMGLPDTEMTAIEHSDFKDPTQPLVLKAMVHYSLLDQAGPAEILLNPWVADRYRTPMFSSTERQSAVRFDYPRTHRSTSIWKLPEGMRVQGLPKPVQLSTDLADFSHSCTQQEKVVTCTRAFSLKKMSIEDMAQYRSAKQFFEEIARHDQEVIILETE
jgi:Domain of Unknown Function with PDB structure (DUF3857)/Transglutaminase-like superfamily